jgi:hypothetical protein
MKPRGFGGSKVHHDAVASMRYLVVVSGLRDLEMVISYGYS